MKTFLVVACCVLVLAGCARAVEGTAVGASGSGIVGAEAIPASEAPDEPVFDPCGIGDSILTAAGLDVSTKVVMRDGAACGWGGTSRRLLVVRVDPDSIDPDSIDPDSIDPDSIDHGPEGGDTVWPDVSGRRQVTAEFGQTFEVFASEGHVCIADTEIGSSAVEVVLEEGYFDPTCYGVELLVRLLLLV